MARTATITEAQILKAAREVFFEQGINATTVDVANRAGISSASIFKRYATKEALLIAAMEEMPFDKVWTPEIEAAIGHGDSRADLLLIAKRIATYTQSLMPRMMLLRAAGNFPMPPRVDKDFAALTAYLASEMTLGRIARGDPTIPARALMHTATGFVVGQSFGSSAQGHTNADTFLEEFIGVLWNGLQPSSKAG
jgi:AcrR family transcriptional regulator